MADRGVNRLNPVGPESARPFGPGTNPGDLPERVERRYYSETRFGVPFAFYQDARTRAAAFVDHGGRLSTDRDDPHVIRDLVAIANHRAWTTLAVRGSAEFRREVWITARGAGLEVRGYRPTERDLQDLARRAERTRSASNAGRTSPPAAHDLTAAGPRTRLRIVEAVVKVRIVDPADRARILAAARDRLASWLDRGARFDDLGIRDRGAGRRERQR